LESFPNLRQVDLVYSPSSFQANLSGGLYTDDYFCAFFHSPDEIRETFEVTGDPSVTGQQIVRALLPHVISFNHLVDYSWSPAHVHDLPAHVRGPARMKLPMGITGTGFLEKFKTLAADRHIVLHVLPAPATDETIYDPDSTPYDAPIQYLPAAQFRDGIHYLGPFIAPAKALFVAHYNQFLQPPGNPATKSALQ
jgi:hypothetical protein